MGDRTTVHLYVPTDLADQAEALFDFGCEYTDDCEDNTTQFTFGEVNYGNLPFLNKLAEAGIAYNSCWEDGGDYKSGCESLRFTPSGEFVLKTLYNGEDVNPSLNRLLELIDQPEALREYILNYKEIRSVLPWDNQVEYGKLHRARQLIAPN